MDHLRVRPAQGCAGPVAHLVPVTGAVDALAVYVAAFGHEVVGHRLVILEIPAGQNHALGRVEEHVPVLAFSDDATDPAVLSDRKLNAGGLVEEIHPHLLGVLGKGNHSVAEGVGLGAEKRRDVIHRVPVGLRHRNLGRIPKIHRLSLNGAIRGAKTATERRQRAYMASETPPPRTLVEARAAGGLVDMISIHALYTPMPRKNNGILMRSSSSFEIGLLMGNSLMQDNGAPLKRMEIRLLGPNLITLHTLGWQTGASSPTAPSPPLIRCMIPARGCDEVRRMHERPHAPDWHSTEGPERRPR